jgi:hypothetical protein
MGNIFVTDVKSEIDKIMSDIEHMVLSKSDIPIEEFLEKINLLINDHPEYLGHDLDDNDDRLLNRVTQFFVETTTGGKCPNGESRDKLGKILKHVNKLDKTFKSSESD